MGRLKGPVHETGQVIVDRVEVDGVFQPVRERGYGFVGVVPGSVEPPVDGSLHVPSQRVEQCRRRQSRGRYRLSCCLRSLPASPPSLCARRQMRTCRAAKETQKTAKMMSRARLGKFSAAGGLDSLTG